jgi:hypothetical protein
MPDQNGFLWPFTELVSVSPDVMARVDSVVVLATSDGVFAAMHGGWMVDVDRARAAGATAKVAERVRLRPPTSNHQFRISAPRGIGRAANDGEVVQGVRLPTLDEPGSRAIEIRLFWAGMQLIDDTRDRIGEHNIRMIERAFRCACGAGFYARTIGVEESIIGESLCDVAELARLLMVARDSGDAMRLSVGSRSDDRHARAVGFLASGLPTAVTIEMGAVAL